MYRKILVPTDGSATALAAACVGAGLAKRLHASVTALYVTLVGVPGAFSGGTIYAGAVLGRRYERLLARQAADALGAVRAQMRRAGVPVSTVRVTARHPWRAILAAARSRGCDLIVMGSHGRGGVQKVLLGSETAKVLAHAKVPVLVCR